MFNWTIQKVNFEEFYFDNEATTVSLIEPSQRIKIHISNFHTKIRFESNFTTNQGLLAYEEIKPAELTLSNVSLTVTFKLDRLLKHNNGLNVTLDQIQINAKSDKIDLVCYDTGIFINEIIKLFDDFKDFTL